MVFRANDSAVVAKVKGACGFMVLSSGSPLYINPSAPSGVVTSGKPRERANKFLVFSPVETEIGDTNTFVVRIAFVKSS